jgi:hypothetical protein
MSRIGDHFAIRRAARVPPAEKCIAERMQLSGGADARSSPQPRRQRTHVALSLRQGDYVAAPVTSQHAHTTASPASDRVIAHRA